MENLRISAQENKIHGRMTRTNEYSHGGRRADVYGIRQGASEIEVCEAEKADVN